MLHATMIICGILLGLLLAAIGVVYNDGSMLEGLGLMLTDLWGVATLLNLGVGLVFVAAWIAVMEPRRVCAAAWIIALFLLGNVTTLAFLIWRMRYANRFSDLFLPSWRSDWTMR